LKALSRIELEHDIRVLRLSDYLNHTSVQRARQTSVPRSQFRGRIEAMSEDDDKPLPLAETSRSAQNKQKDRLKAVSVFAILD
jgi:hypothetical protein